MADNAAKTPATKRVDKVIYQREGKKSRVVAHDNVITEQPLQVSLHWQNDADSTESKVFAITMRTLGDESLLILGLLFSEGVISQHHDIEHINVEESDQENSNNIWHVKLVKGVKPNLTSIERFQATYSSCGLCGATSLKALALKVTDKPSALNQKNSLKLDVIYVLGKTMRQNQQLFSCTGGVHGAALFTQYGQLLALHEDIGRHNAVDKLIGQGLQESLLPAKEQLLLMLVSGRVSFEIVQKAVMAGISILVAVGAPSDLAIKAAQRFELTLIGFVKEDSFNVYHGDWRLKV